MKEIKISKAPKTKLGGVKVGSARIVKVRLKSGTVRSFRAPNKRSVKAIRRYTNEHNLVAM